MEINLTPGVLKKWRAVLLIVAVLVGGWYYLVTSGVFNREALLDDAELAQAGGVAAVAGVETFFTLDYEEVPEDWLARVCAQSTEEGCGVTKSFFLTSIEEILEEKKPKTTCNASYIEKVDFGVETDGVGDEEEVAYEWEVWTVNYTLSNPWEGAEKEQEIYVQVNTEEGKWKFARILFNQEISKYSEEISQ
ncbi:MAG: hypothetical protein HN741_12735 [Anaerolineae bacterium]|jgi:hypothetical protein|nr:hypothetical protein [Anaerolineae bacterium]